MPKKTNTSDTNRPNLITRDFVTAGQALFTVELSADFVKRNPEYKAHYTYRVREVEFDNGTKRFLVDVLSGPDNTTSYRYLGRLHDDTGHVALTPGSRATKNSKSWKIVDRVLTAIWQDRGSDVLVAGWKVHHEGRCGRCGRTLTVPESVESGIGPHCAKVMSEAQEYAAVSHGA